jgi:hypothetical protein
LCTTPSAECWWKVDSAKRQSKWWVKIRTASGLIAWAISKGNFDNQDLPDWIPGCRMQEIRQA